MKLAAAELQRVEQALEIMTVEQLEQELRIAAWGRWAGGALSQIGYPPCMIAQRKSGPPPDINDEEALALDRAIAALPGEERAVIEMLYRLCLPTILVSKKLRVSRFVVRARRFSALERLVKGKKVNSKNIC